MVEFSFQAQPALPVQVSLLEFAAEQSIFASGVGVGAGADLSLHLLSVELHSHELEFVQAIYPSEVHVRSAFVHAVAGALPPL